MINNLSVLIGGEIDYAKGSLLDYIEQIAQVSPQKIALQMDQESLTYAELMQQVKRWAVQLSQLDLRHEEPIAVLLAPSIDSILAQLSILYVGGTCVPLDESQPTLRLQNMLDNLQVRTLVTHQKTTHALKIDSIFSTELLKQNKEAVHVEAKQLSAEHRTHILHTSGTSGTPKAVQILAQGIMRLAFNQSFCPFNAQDIVSHISNPTFDASLFEIYGALLNGCTLQIISKDKLLDVYQFEQEIQKHNITIMAITTALFNLIALSKPNIFSGVHSIIVGGEPANAVAMKEVLLHSHVPNLRNGYGPTECTTYATTRHVTLDYLENTKVIDIGYPIDETNILILDNNHQLLKQGEIGEICIAGDGVSRSYANNDQENENKFICIELNGQQQRIYKTGDIGLMNQAGFIECYGRKDNQIKIRGHRINLEEIEQEILHTNVVQSVVVDIIKPKRAHEEAYIIAYIVEKDGFTLHGLKTELAAVLPKYMLPRFCMVDCIPLNQNGKADKHKLRESLHVHQTPDEEIAVTTLSQLKQLWADLLNYSAIQDDDNFFDLGGSSLQVATLVIDIEKKFDVRLSISELYEYAMLEQLADFIEHKRNQTEQQPIDDHPIVDVMQRDAELALPVIEQPIVPLNWLADDEGHVFLTGATGFLGAFFLADLCKQEQIQKVYCLVRANTRETALERIIENQKKYDLWQEADLAKIEVLCGHLDELYFGLGQERYDQLGRSISCIFHLGAHVNYIQPYAVHRPANVIGTLNVIQFAVHQRIKPLHYTSSIAAFGPTGFFNGVTHLAEDEALDAHLDCLKYDTGYSQSQWVAEKIVHRAQQHGLPVNIYRPGFIMGDSKKGIGNEKDFVARLIKGCLEIKAFPLLQKQKKEFIAVDYVSQSLLEIAKMQCYGGHYNFVPLNPDESVNLIELYEYLVAYGYDLKLVTYQEWISILEGSDNLTGNPLLPLVPMLKEPVYGALTRWEVYENMPVYETHNIKRILGEQLVSPTLNQAILNKYLTYWLKSGFITTQPNI